MEFNGDDEEEFDIGRRTWARHAEPIQQDAYREGFDVARKAAFQGGFDIGYTEGYNNGFKMGLINGALRVAGELKNSSLDALRLTPFELPHRGGCWLCPPGPPAEYSTLEQLLDKKPPIDFPDEAVADILSSFEPKS